LFAKNVLMTAQRDFRLGNRLLKAYAYPYPKMHLRFFGGIF